MARCHFLGLRDRQIPCAISASARTTTGIDSQRFTGAGSTTSAWLATIDLRCVGGLLLGLSLAPASLALSGFCAHDAQQLSADAAADRFVVRGLEQFLDRACAVGNVIGHAGECDPVSLQTPRELQSESSRNRAVIFRKVVA